MTQALRRLLCNVSIQPHFNNAFSVWYPNLTKKIKHSIQTTQNKCVRFWLQLDNLTHIFLEEFECLSWLPVTYRFKQCVKSIVFKYVNAHCSNYLSEIFNVAIENNIQLRGSFQKLKYAFRKTNNVQFALSYIGLTFRNKTPGTLKRANSLNTFKHNLKKFSLNELKIYIMVPQQKWTVFFEIKIHG